MKKAILALTALALPMSAANAAVFVSAYDTGDTYTGPAADIDFDTNDGGISGGAIVTGSIPAQYAQPTSDDANAYYTVGPIDGSPAVLDLSSFGTINTFSLLWGSVDETDDYNLIEILDSMDNVLGSVNGEQVGVAMGFSPPDGSRNAQVRVLLTGDTATNAAKLRFSADQNAFEFDNLAINPVPEPSTWLMLLLGFAGIGATLRRGKKQATPAYA